MSDTTRSEGSTRSYPADWTLSLLMWKALLADAAPPGSTPLGILCIQFASAQLNDSSPAFAIAYKANTRGK